MTLSLREALAASPTLFPLNVDIAKDAVQFVHLSETEYASASFLDHRLLQPNQRWGLIPWSDLCPAAQGLPLSCNFIFHISHSGSTLLSRLLAGHPDFFSLREPAILRLFATGYAPQRLPIYLGLWSRTFQPQQKSLIKTTSFVNSIATELLSLVPESRAILLYVPLPTFLAALLDGSMSDITGGLANRFVRLQHHHSLPEISLEDLSPGEAVALSWLTEMLTLADINQKYPDRSRWLDFDSFLEQPEPHLAEVLAHFGVQADAKQLLAGPHMQCYAKRPDVHYDSNFRRRLLQQAELKFTDEIERGIRWLETINLPTHLRLPSLSY